MIRRAQKEDLERIYELGSSLHENYKKVYDLNQVLEDSFSKIFVSLRDDYVIGFLMVTELEDTVDILDIVVDEKYRNQHVGSRLLNYMIDDMGDGVEMLTLEVAIDNAPAIHIYQKFGFEIVNKRLFYYGEKDAYLMGRRIER